MLNNSLHIKSYNEFNKIFEGGSAISGARRIREDEVAKTLESINKELLTKLDLTSDDYIVIGSIGKKLNPSDTSGDIDIGISSEALASSLGTSDTLKDVSTALNSEMESIMNKISKDSQVRYLKGLNIVSVGWPIEGDIKNGTIQLDLIPIADMEWAKFIYYSPDQRKNESKYKSAHRNWLFSSVLSARKKIIEEDDEEIWVYENPYIVLSDGLYKHTKSYKGKLKPRLKTAKRIDGTKEFITRDPEKFIEYTLGRKHNLDSVKTFEDVMAIIKSPDFDLKDKLPEIREKYLEFMERSKLETPKEIKEL